jgi:hypothetical protein
MSSGSSDLIRVEGFSSTLRGKRIWIFSSDESLLANRLHVVENEVFGRGRKILILADNRMMPRWASKIQWDAVFRLRDPSDGRLAITYIQYATKPLRLIWLGEEPNQQLLQKYVKEDVTILGIGNYIPRHEWDAIFFSGGMESRVIEEGLILRMGSVKLSQFSLRTVIPELRVAKAGLVWSNIDEEDKSGYLYWYDLAEGQMSEERINPTEAASFLRELADRIASAK